MNNKEETRCDPARKIQAGMTLAKVLLLRCATV